MEKSGKRRQVKLAAVRVFAAGMAELRGFAIAVYRACIREEIPAPRARTAP
jgi:hypothetical protein